MRLDGYTIVVRTPDGTIVGTVDNTSAGWIWRCLASYDCNEHSGPTRLMGSTDELLNHLAEDHVAPPAEADDE